MGSVGAGVAAAGERREQLGGGFERIVRTVPAGPARTLRGATLAVLELSCDGAGPEAVWVRPWTWDAPHDGLAEQRRTLPVGERLQLVAGAYGVADAAAWNAGAEPRFDGRRDRPDGHLYLATGHAPEPGEPWQDACGWLALQLGPDGPTAVVAWETSATVVATVERTAADRVRVEVAWPPDLFAPALAAGEALELPAVVTATLPGGVDGALRALQALVVERYVPERRRARVRRDAVWPYLVVDTWGLGEAIAEADVVRRMRDAADLGAEVFTVDKGWERAVGDWHPNERFPGGLPRLVREASELGLGLALWCALGNASPDAPVAREHPDWLAAWRGATPVFSFGNHALCLGHEPARAWVLGEVDRLVREGGLTWLLHDFETIARCDATGHTHDPGAGEAACAAGLAALLDELRARHPYLVVENCWNGGKPIDLAMVARHDTTIGDDWARARPNRVARAGLGRLLPPDWCSSYMGDEDVPPRYQVASFLIGGPWVLMGDMDGWDDERRAVVRRGVEIYRRWRPRLRRARLDVLLPPAHAGSEPDALLATEDWSGRALLVVARHEGPAGPVAIRPAKVDPTRRYRVVDEWTGDAYELDGRDLAAGLDVALGAGPDAAVLGLEPLDLGHR